MTRATTGQRTRIVFMGTPDFSVPSLQAVLDAADANHWHVVAVATQPDRRAGRGKKLAESPIKRLALQHDIPVLQPASLRKDLITVEALRATAPDLYVVAAYGLILPKSVLAIPTYGSINVHASLLPAWRGASPITAAILSGEEETGVSIMLMDEGMDTGPVLAQVREPIRPDDTTESLSARLADTGARALVDTLPRWIAGDIAPLDQSELPGEPSACHMIKKSEGRIDWRQPAEQIERMTRAYTPWPSAYTDWGGQPLKIWKADVEQGGAEPGLVIATEDGPAVGTGRDLLLLRELQPAGKRPMDAKSFLNGAPSFIGSMLGESDDD